MNTYRTGNAIVPACAQAFIEVYMESSPEQFLLHSSRNQSTLIPSAISNSPAKEPPR